MPLKAVSWLTGELRTLFFRGPEPCMIILDVAVFMLALAFAASIVFASFVEVARSHQPGLLKLSLHAGVHRSRRET